MYKELKKIRVIFDDCANSTKNDGVFKLNFEKVFDMIDWDLNKHGF